ncbi:MAG: hypothetical protein PVJ89_02910 [Planctomycetota bacterium]|jgi:hypothetical protein
MAVCAPLAAALLGLLPALQPAGAGPSDDDPTAGGTAAAVELLRALSREPRVPGTDSHERAVSRVEAALRARGLDPERARVSVPRAVPTRSEVLLFEDDIAASPFAGLKERWDPAATPADPLPAAYAWNPDEASVRGPVVDLGAGLEADFEEAARLRVPLEGAVALVSLPASPASRKTNVRGIAARAAARGCVGVLVAPVRPGPGRDDFVLADTAAANAGDRNAAASGPARLALPCAPVRSAEAAALRERLRVRRVRGADGRATTLRIGPGPVEASVTVECPFESVTASVLTVTVPALTEGLRHLVPTDHRSDQALAGAPTVAAAVAAAALLAGEDRPGSTTLTFGPRRAALPAPAGRPGLVIDAALAPRAGAPLLVRLGRLGPSRLTPRIDEFHEQLAGRLAGQLEARLEAAAAWIACGLAGEDDPRRAAGARAARGLERLLAPLPSER